MLMKVGSRELEMGGPHLTELRSSNDIVHDVVALRARMEEDRYLLIRGFHERAKVLHARTSILGKIEKMGKLDRDTLLEAEWLTAARASSWAERRKSIPIGRH